MYGCEVWTVTPKTNRLTVQLLKQNATMGPQVTVEKALYKQGTVPYVGLPKAVGAM